MSNLLFQNTDENGMAGQFFVPSPVPQVVPSTIQQPAMPVSIAPPSSAFLPTGSFSSPVPTGSMFAPSSHVHPVIPQPVSAPPVFGVQPLNVPAGPTPGLLTPPIGPPPISALSSSPSSAGRYVVAPGMGVIGQSSKLSPQMQPNAPMGGMPPPPMGSSYRSPHSYNPLPPVSNTAPLLNRSEPPQMSPVLSPATHQPSLPSSPPIPPVPLANVTYWFYQNPSSESESEEWIPFSVSDSNKLEDAFNRGSVDPIEVAGGRYIADLINGLKTPVYWTEDFEVRIRRGGWYASSGGGFQPLGEEASEIVEMTFSEAKFPTKVATPDGEVVIHNTEMAVLLPPGCTPDQYGVVPEGQPLPRMIKRKVKEDELGRMVPADEPDGVACALILIACGGSSGERSVGNVDSFRGRMLEMRRTHFSHKQKVDVLPVHWHDGHTEQAQGAKLGLDTLTLPSVQRLRDFTNNAMLDIMFYSSPVYAQPMVEATATQIENMLQLYREKNPSFQGEVALIGHGISSLVIFDILANQPSENQKVSKEPSLCGKSLEPQSVSEAGASGVSGAGTDTLQGLLEKLSIESILPKLEAEEVDLASLMILEEADLKDIGLPMGPRKKLLKYIAEKKVEAETPVPVVLPEMLDEIPDITLDEGMTVNVQYKQFDSGAGQPFITYPRLSFEPYAFFGMGAPIGLLLALRGVEQLGDEFKFETCKKFLNIFHPFDPFAYRIEPFIKEESPKPVQIPHHKGRKRLHLEIADNLGRAAAEVKAGLLRSMRTVMSSVKRATGWEEDEQQAEQIANELFQSQTSAHERRNSESSLKDEEIEIGILNGGERIDYQLQERPLEMFNEYMFAFQSHRCYWTSEDAALMILKQIYSRSPDPMLPPTSFVSQKLD